MNRVADPVVPTLQRRIAYDGTRTPTKTALFLVVCLAWLLPGLVGHDPWKTDEALVLSAVAGMLRTGDWAVPLLAGEPYLDRARSSSGRPPPSAGSSAPGCRCSCRTSSGARS